MKKSAWMLGTLLLTTVAGASSQRVVIEELRKLKASLPVNDPSRAELTLRLADRVADEYFTGKENRKESDRVEAIALYLESLNARSGEGKVKIQFQLARLYAEKNADPSSLRSAKELFEQVRANSGVLELKREALLRLAEFAEANPSAAAQATSFYREALQYCEGSDSCSYSHYRLGWIERNQNRFTQAIDEMKLALWDSKGQIREEALRDLISFMGLSNADPDAHLSYVDQLAAKLNRPALLQDLSSSYFAAGNKGAAVKVLALTHSRSPSLYSEIRLMEEYYGLRQWDSFRQILSQFTATVEAGASSNEWPEIEKIGRRLATQLDGERTTDPSHAGDFKQFTLSYLKLFPKLPERAKIMEGWIAAENQPETQLNQLKLWLADPQFGISGNDEIKLRELRAAIAQKMMDQNASNETFSLEAIGEFTQLIGKNPSKAREYQYMRARAYYSMKNFTAAIPDFTRLANAGSEPDTWALQSQHLLLDIYNQKKDLPHLITQAKSWTQNETLAKNPKVAVEIREMNQIADQAEFEFATSRTESQESLESFIQYCKSGKFLPKSCDNAKVLAVKLNRHPALVSVLEHQVKADPKKESELMDAYEEGGYFLSAARLMEKENQKNPDFKTQIKIALFYEIGRDSASRDQTLKRISQAVTSKKMKLDPSEETAWLRFVNDARILSPSLLVAVQSSESKAYIAEMLEEQGQGNSVTLQTLLGFADYQGPAWSNRVVEKTENLAKEEGKIGFYGKNGQTAFQKRVNRLKELNLFAEKYLNGSDSSTRAKLLSILVNSHERIGQEILESPIPSSLNEEQVAQVKLSLAEMAKPFQEKTESLKTLLQTEEQKITLGMTQSAANGAFDEKMLQDLFTQLHQDPKNSAVLNQIKTLFAQAGMARPAAYFEGRIQGL